MQVYLTKTFSIEENSQFPVSDVTRWKWAWERKLVLLSSDSLLLDTNVTLEHKVRTVASDPVLTAHISFSHKWVASAFHAGAVSVIGLTLLHTDLSGIRNYFNRKVQKIPELHAMKEDMENQSKNRYRKKKKILLNRFNMIYLLWGKDKVNEWGYCQHSKCLSIKVRHSHAFWHRWWSSWWRKKQRGMLGHFFI